MKDVHVHFLHGRGCGYSKSYLDEFIVSALNKGIDQLYLLEHTDQFFEFDDVYLPIKKYNNYQSEWITKRMNDSIEPYIKFIEYAKTLDLQ